MSLSRRTFLAAGAVAGGAALAPQVASAAPNGAAAAGSAHRPTGASGFDTTVWRELGHPLVSGRRRGPLHGEQVAVKDLYAIAGHRIGAGNPTWLSEAPIEHHTAAAVRHLLHAGADVAGLAQTDEFAYSIAGTNGHYGTPPNPAAPDRISGGSSSGPASAVSLHQASVGLGTDTGGSIRVPSSYQGLYGIRTTHGSIDRTGLLPLAQSFDTVGWLARDPRTLARVGEVLLPHHHARPLHTAIWSPDLVGIADTDVAGGVEHAIGAWARSSRLPRLHRTSFDTSVLPTWVKAFQTVQGFEAWANHGAWISTHWDSLNPDIKARFVTASGYTRADRDAAAKLLAQARATIDHLVGDAVLLLPSASSIAPLRSDAALGGSVIEATRAKTFQLTCLAGITGRCAVSVPVQHSGAPFGMCLVGPRGSDRRVLELAQHLRAAGISR